MSSIPIIHRVATFFDKHPHDIEETFAQKIVELRARRERAIQEDPNKPSVVILGAGPAGSIRGIESLLNGNPTTIIEKRAQNGAGRPNTVALGNHLIYSLKNRGVYHYLVENKLIYAGRNGYFSVTIADLERAMRAVIDALSDEPVIHYHSQVEEIEQPQDAKVNIQVRDLDTQEIYPLNAVDILVVAEGSHSETNRDILHNRRIEVLPPIPVIVATFKDNRPSITGAATALSYGRKTFMNIAVTVGYHALYFFKFFLTGDFFIHRDRSIGGAIILSTPGQHYLGSGLSQRGTEKMMALRQREQTLREALEREQQEGVLSAEELHIQEREWEKAQEKYNAFLHHWTIASFCWANFFQTAESLFIHRNIPSFAFFMPNYSAQVVEIGADYAEQKCGFLNQTVFLVAGDALFTVDPSTGLGCNLAISSASTFLEVLRMPFHCMEHNLEYYKRRTSDTIHRGHLASVRNRRLYRPDAVPAGIVV